MVWACGEPLHASHMAILAVLGVTAPSVRRCGADGWTPGPSEHGPENESPQGETRRTRAPLTKSLAPGAPDAGPSALEPQRLAQLREMGVSMRLEELAALGAGINQRADSDEKAAALLCLLAVVDGRVAAAACVGLLSSPHLEDDVDALPSLSPGSGIFGRRDLCPGHATLLRKLASAASTAQQRELLDVLGKALLGGVRLSRVGEPTAPAPASQQRRHAPPVPLGRLLGHLGHPPALADQRHHELLDRLGGRARQRRRRQRLAVVECARRRDAGEEPPLTLLVLREVGVPVDALVHLRTAHHVAVHRPTEDLEDASAGVVVEILQRVKEHAALVVVKAHARHVRSEVLGRPHASAVPNRPAAHEGRV